MKDTLDNTITACYKPEHEPMNVNQFMDTTMSMYFSQKPLNPTTIYIKNYDGGSLGHETILTEFMEIILTLQRYISRIRIILPDSIKNAVKINIVNYFKDLSCEAYCFIHIKIIEINYNGN